MADAQNNLTLATEAAEALLTEIKQAADGASDRGSDFVLALAQAYATVREAMPKPAPRAAAIR